MFIVLVMPYSVAVCYCVRAGISFMTTNDPTIATLRELTQMLDESNFSFNFVVYLLSSSTFRQHVREVFGRIRLGKLRGGGVARRDVAVAPLPTVSACVRPTPMVQLVP